MTIAAAYLTSEGVVLGTDSLSTISTPKGVVQSLSYAQKVFEVGQQSRLGICTWGAGNIGGISHRTLVARLADSIDQQATSVEDTAKAFIDIVKIAYGNGGNTGDVGYVLGGWDVSTHLPSCYWFMLQPKVEPETNRLGVGQAQFFGNPEFFARVFHGFDAQLPEKLLAEFLKANLGIPEDQLRASFKKAFDTAVAPLQAVGFPDLPIREAIDFIDMYLHVTIKAHKFRFGPPICGGPIEIGFITTDRPFRWAKHKKHDRALYD